MLLEGSALQLECRNLACWYCQHERLSIKIGKCKHLQHLLSIKRSHMSGVQIMLNLLVRQDHACRQGRNSCAYWNNTIPGPNP